MSQYDRRVGRASRGRQQGCHGVLGCDSCQTVPEGSHGYMLCGTDPASRCQLLVLHAFMPAGRYLSVCPACLIKQFFLSKTLP